jgi:osmoprotectant transport system substrate-binding protein
MVPVHRGAKVVVGTWFRRSLAGVGLVLALGAAGCGSSSTTNTTNQPTTVAPGTAPREPGAGKPAVTIGTKNFTEAFILGQLYAQALRAKGFTVNLHSNIGPSEVMDRRLASAAIDGYPEYTGTVLSVFGHDIKRPASALEAYRMAAAIQRRHGAVLLAMAPAENTDVLITTPAYAAAHKLHSLSDLARLPPGVKLAGPPEFRTRFNGLVGMRQEYGIRTLRFLPMAIGQQYHALADGQAQLAVAFTTDGNLTQGGHVLLADPKNIFGFQNVTFVVRDTVLTQEGPAFAATINAVSARLSTQALRLMNAAVSLDQQSPAGVARQFLGANGLA